MQKAEKHHVQFVEVGENTAEALEWAKESLDLIPEAIEYIVRLGTLTFPCRRGNTVSILLTVLLLCDLHTPTS